MTGKVYARLVDAAQRLDLRLICTNTTHRMASAVQAAVQVPLPYIADPTAKRIKAAGFQRVGLLGTAFTMEHDFYKGRLAQQQGLSVTVPNEEDRATVHRVIYEELVARNLISASREAYRAIIARTVEAGAEAVILGCTEIMLLIGPKNSPVPIFDTTAIHAKAANRDCVGRLNGNGACIWSILNRRRAAIKRFTSGFECFSALLWHTMLAFARA